MSVRRSFHSMVSLCLSCLAAAATVRAAPDVSLGQVQPSGGPWITFEVYHRGPYTSSIADLGDDRRIGPFRVWSPRSQTRWDEGEFTYLLVVEGPAAATPPEQYRVIARANGSFEDQFLEVPIRVALQPGQVGAQGHVRLLVGSADPPASLLAVNAEKARPVHVARAPYSVTLKNADSQRRVFVDRVDVRVVPPDLWNKTPTVVKDDGGLPLEIVANGEGQLTLDVDPAPLRVLAASLLDRDAPKPLIELAARYEVPPIGLLKPLGRHRYQVLTLPIQFRPTLPQLALSLALGCAAGCLLRILMRLWRFGRRGLLSFVLASGAISLLVAVVVEAIGIGLVLGGSSLVLLGVDLNPVGLLGAFLVGTGAGLAGREVAEQLKRKMEDAMNKLFGQPDRQRAAGGAASGKGGT